MIEKDKSFNVTRNVYYAGIADDRRSMDIYTPVSGQGPFPVAVNIHGGAWSEGSKDWSWFSDRLPEQGAIGVSINYRLSPAVHAPVHLQDLKTAIRFLRSHASDYNLDPDRIAVYGHSAGGHLAAMAGVTADLDLFPDDCPWQKHSDRVTCVGVFSGPSDMQGIPEHDPQFSDDIFGSHAADNPIYMAYSPLTYIRPSLPPFLIVHGSGDTTVEVDHAYRMHDALLKYGNKTELMVIEGADHMFEVDGVSSQEQIWVRFLAFLKAHL